ncbi:hypothetical protein [Novosphingobium sp.]|uniref:hypothetical protein n=1 Tax=Novosphingobium sp. TaxID=1874826 RepID=UPI0039183456
MMFKALIVEKLYGLSEPQAEFQILDRHISGRLLRLDRMGRSATLPNAYGSTDCPL